MTSKVALVTGGSRGLGRSIATRLAESGVDVLITYRTDEFLAGNVVDELEKAGVKAGKVRLDVTDSLDTPPSSKASTRSFRNRSDAPTSTTW